MSKNLTPRLNRLEPNLILDAGFEIWPEGNSRSVANNTLAYGGVLYRLQNNSTAITLTNSQQSSVPSGTAIPFSNQVSKTAAGTLTTTTNTRLITYIEGYNVMPIYDKDFSIIFWVKSSVAGNRSVSLQNTAITHSLVKQYTINQANTWELKVVTFPALNTCPGTIDRTNSYGLAINHAIVTGSTVQTASLGIWQVGNLVAGVGEDTTWLTGTTHDFSIAGVMCIPGDWTGLNASTYRFLRAGRNFQEEVTLSQRYYEKSYNLDVAPASATNDGYYVSYSTSGNYISGGVKFSVSKRANPTTTTYNPSTGTPNQARGLSGGGTQALTAQAPGHSGFAFFANVAVTDYYGFQWVADARF